MSPRQGRAYSANRLLRFAQLTYGSASFAVARAEVRALGGIFGGRVAVHHPALELFHLLDMKLFAYQNRLVNVACDSLDRLAYRYLPPLRPYGYKQIVVLQKH